jgi:peptide/nickel transport system permease protein
MIRYITKRILLFVPTLFVITLLAFIINLNAPGDPVDRMSGAYSEDASKGQAINFKASQEYWYQKLGLNLPVFYITVTPLSVDDNLYTIIDPAERHNARRMVIETGTGTHVITLYNQCYSLINDTNISQKHKGILQRLLKNSNLTDWKKLIKDDEYMFTVLGSQLELITKNTTIWKSYVPILRLHADNQYHRWIFGDGNSLTGNGYTISRGIIRGDFGISYQTMQPITQVIGDKIKWSLFFSLISVLLAYLISIPTGIYVSSIPDSKTDRITTTMMYILYSLPSFWLATLLLMTFANPDVLSWLPASGVKPVTGYMEDAGFFGKIKQSLPYMILPLVCYTYSSYAFLTRTIRSSMLENLSTDYIRTAQAKGMSPNRVLIIHAFRNSLLPLVTIFVNIFPLMLGGSVILETIFSIPGMGLETIQAIQTQNYPMVTAIFTITGILTMMGYLLSDIIYVIADPRIKIAGNK